MSIMTESTAALLRDLEYQAVTMFRLRHNLAHMQGQDTDKRMVRYVKRDLRTAEKTVQKLSLQFVDLFTQGNGLFDGSQDRLATARDHIAQTLQTAEQTAKEG